MKQDTTQTVPDRAMEFSPVEGGAETTSAGTLLVLAYLVMWALLLGFVLMSWRKLGRVEARIVGLERTLATARTPDQ